MIPYDKGSVLSYFMDHAHVDSLEHEEKGARIKVKCHKADRDKYREYLDEKD